MASKKNTCINVSLKFLKASQSYVLMYMDNYAGIITLYEDVEYHSDRRMDLLVPDTCTICYPVFAINFVVLKQQIGFRLNLYWLNCSGFIPPVDEY